MRKIKFLLLITISLFVFNSCEDDAKDTIDLNFISFEGSDYDFGVDVGSSTTIDLEVYSNNFTSSDRTFNVFIDEENSTATAEAYSVPTSVTIPANTNKGILPVTISDINIGVAGKKLMLAFESEEGLLTGGKMQLNIIQSCPGNEVFLDVDFDKWSSESSWKLEDSSNNIVASGDSYKDNASSISTSFCLAAGTYKFTVNDAYGDGGAGVTLTKNDVILVDIAGDSYTTEASATFDVE